MQTCKTCQLKTIKHGYFDFIVHVFVYTVMINLSGSIIINFQCILNCRRSTDVGLVESIIYNNTTIIIIIIHKQTVQCKLIKK